VYEVIHNSGGPVKLAFDLEWQRDKHPYSGADVLPQFEEALRKYLKKRHGIRDVKAGRDMLVATATRPTSTGSTKESYHYTVPAVTVPSWSEDHKKLADDFAEYIRRTVRQSGQQQHPWSVLIQADGSLVMDEKVYTSNRNWRTLYSTKLGSSNPPRPLVPYRRAWIPVGDEDAQADSKERFMNMLVTAVPTGFTASADQYLMRPRHHLTIAEAQPPLTTRQRRSTPTARHSGYPSQHRSSAPHAPANRPGSLSGQKLEDLGKELQRQCKPLRNVKVRIISQSPKDDGTVFVNFKPCPFGCAHQNNNSYAHLSQPDLPLIFATPGMSTVQHYHVVVKCHSRRCKGKRCFFRWMTSGS